MDEQWQKIIDGEKDKPYFQTLKSSLLWEYNHFRVFPKPAELLRAFELTPLNNVKVVILGQDPYHEVQQANGLAFSVNPSAPIPRSLVNIFTELKNDLGIMPPKNGDLTKWAQRGVLLLNTILSVREHLAMSHQNLGWQTFTDQVIKVINAQNRPIVFILWGNQAIAKKALLDNPQHLIICSVHPSPLSAARGFFGSRPFSRANTFLKEDAINWDLN